MAQHDVDVMDARLREWSEWLRVGPAGGWPTVNVLHKDWLPPVGGGVSGGAGRVLAWSERERRLHGAVCELPPRLLATVIAVYVVRLSVEGRAKVLGCTASAVRSRSAEARRLLAVAIGLRG